ncbi:hypothetical protein Fuma_00813 [Fuerstiella marisgermanici]|uniref:Uncharacterized protein n=1 Tax=Fuerstiella marisgermanici TaxID=1891926 RepID=A0A1P8WAW5_9PLAN|nr:hypothetical protein Fuma_00813 [Fuerstiella marisgermanici]
MKSQLEVAKNDVNLCFHAAHSLRVQRIVQVSRCAAGYFLMESDLRM